jgi:HAE1 family hydrophobic/amphiphilic exporter-1
MRDVAKVTECGPASFRVIFRARRNPPASTIVLAVSRQAGANAVEVARSVMDLMPQLRLELPGSIRLIPTFDRSQTIVHSVADVQTTLFIAFLLVILVIFVFLGRATDTLIPVVALPLSLLLTVSVMYALNYSINNLTLMAMTLAIGFLVDDAIVFLENVVRRAQHGESIYRATLNSAGEISFTILSMTLSLAAVFIPLVFMPGLLGRIFREFAITCIVAIFASGLISLTLTPLMCARLLAERGPGHKKHWMERLNDRFFKPTLAFYSRTLGWFLNHGWLAAPIIVLCAFGVLFFFKGLPFTLLPTGDSSVIRGFFIVQEGASPQEQRQLQDKLDPVLQANPAVDKYFTVAGRAGQAAGVFTVIFLKDAKDPSLDRVGRGRPAQKPQHDLGFFQRLIHSRSCASTSVGLGALRPIHLRTERYNPSEVYAAADALGAKLHTYEGFNRMPRPDLFRNTPNLNIEIDRDRASLYGVSTVQLQSLLAPRCSQNYVYLIKKPDDQYQVILEVEDSERSSPEDLQELYVKSDGNNPKLVPVRTLTKSETRVGLQSVNHTNQFTSVTFGFDTKPGVALGDVTDFIQKAAAETLPPTVKGELQGEGLVLQQLFQALPFLILGALFVMTSSKILAESYVHR